MHLVERLAGDDVRELERDIAAKLIAWKPRGRTWPIRHGSPCPKGGILDMAAMSATVPSLMFGMTPAQAEGLLMSSQPETLKWEVFVTPGIPVVTRDRPAGVRETYFQAMASTLIYGARDAVLVDSFLTTEQTTALADWVASKSKNLTTIYITRHGILVGAATHLDRFNAQLVATRARW
jgi:hypothetical protein